MGLPSWAENFHKGALIAVGLAFDVEADDLAAIGNDVAAVAFDGRRGADADVFPVADLTGAELGDDELPEEFAGLFVEAHEHATVARLFGIAGALVIGADVDAATSDNGSAVGLRAEFSDPAHALGGLGIDGLGLGQELSGGDGLGHGQTLAGGNHIAGRRAAPHGPIARAKHRNGQQGRRKQREGKAQVIHWR